MRFISLRACAVAIAAIGFALTAQPANAGFITYTGKTSDENGTGFGTLTSLLVVRWSGEERHIRDWVGRLGR